MAATEETQYLHCELSDIKFLSTVWKAMFSRYVVDNLPLVGSQ